MEGLKAADSEAAFEELAESNPSALVKLIESGQLRDSRLTVAAEILGKLGPTELAVGTLLGLLSHKSPLVREGAVLGLGYQWSQVIRERLEYIRDNDPSPGVRMATDDVLSENDA